VSIKQFLLWGYQDEDLNLVHQLCRRPGQTASMCRLAWVYTDGRGRKGLKLLVSAGLMLNVASFTLKNLSPGGIQIFRF
jgi:hypothetical protein